MNNDDERDREEEKYNQNILDTGDGESGAEDMNAKSEEGAEDMSKFSEGVDQVKEEIAAARDTSDNDMVEDLIEAGTWGLAEAHAKKFPGHSVTVIRDKSFDNPDVEVIRVACNGSPDLFLTGIRVCEFWEEVPI
jgi:hypothetical protein